MDTIEEKDIQNISEMPRRVRLDFLFRYLGISQKDLAERSGRSGAMISIVLRGSGVSKPIEDVAYTMLKELLGKKCPAYEILFSKDGN